MPLRHSRAAAPGGCDARGPQCSVAVARRPRAWRPRCPGSAVLGCCVPGGCRARRSDRLEACRRRHGGRSARRLLCLVTAVPGGSRCSELQCPEAAPPGGCSARKLRCWSAGCCVARRRQYPVAALPGGSGSRRSCVGGCSGRRLRCPAAARLALLALLVRRRRWRGWRRWRCWRCWRGWRCWRCWRRWQRLPSDGIARRRHRPEAEP